MHLVQLGGTFCIFSKSIKETRTGRSPKKWLWKTNIDLQTYNKRMENQIDVFFFSKNTDETTDISANKKCWATFFSSKVFWLSSFFYVIWLWFISFRLASTSSVCVLHLRYDKNLHLNIKISKFVEHDLKKRFVSYKTTQIVLG